MKIYIGKPRYRKISNLSDLYLRLKYPEDFNKFNPKEDKFSTILDSVDNAIQYILNKTINRYYDGLDHSQVQYIKIDDYDVWSMDNTLASIIVPMLHKLKDAKDGAPIVDDLDVPEHLRPSKSEQEEFNSTGATDPNFFKRWDYVVDEMIYAFTFERDEDLIDYYQIGEDNTLETSAYMKTKNRIDNGRMLFAKYYSSLWD